MGQKINPFSYRIGVVNTWPVKWFFPGKGTGLGRYPYAQLLKEDEVIRRVINQRIKAAGVAQILIERTSIQLRIHIKAARPGLIIGQGGKGIEELTNAIARSLKAVRTHIKTSQKITLSLNVEELKRSETSAAHMAQLIATDLEKRMHFRRSMKKYIDQAMQSRDVKGVKVLCSGRLGGAEIARRESLKKGALPLQTLRANIDYGFATAFTTYGTIGIKVWIYKGEVFSRNEKTEEKPENNRRQAK